MFGATTRRAKPGRSPGRARLQSQLYGHSADDVRDRRLAHEFPRVRNPMLQKAFTAKPERVMNSIIYLVGLIVVVLAILSFLGLR